MLNQRSGPDLEGAEGITALGLLPRRGPITNIDIYFDYMFTSTIFDVICYVMNFCKKP